MYSGPVLVKDHFEGRTGFAVCVLLALSLFLSSPACASDDGIRHVVSTSPEWETFTNSDGTGLYHEILREVFGLYGITVSHEYAPSVRAEKLVLQGLADIMVCDDRAGPGLTLLRYPLYENTFYAFFNRQYIGPWKGEETMRDREVVCQRGYYYQDNFSVPVFIHEVSSGTKAAEMVIMGRADFYVDDLSLIRQSLEKLERPVDMEVFDIRAAGARAYRPQFNLTKRGIKVMRLFRDGLMKLHETGRLQPIYEKWGHPYPDFARY